jgi:hypothetical protein
MMVNLLIGNETNYYRSTAIKGEKKLVQEICGSGISDQGILTLTVNLTAELNCCGNWRIRGEVPLYTRLKVGC